MGKRNRGKDKETQNEFSGVCFMKTLNLFDQYSTLRAHLTLMGFAGGSDHKKSVCSVRDLGSMPGSGRFPGDWNSKHSSILA